MSNEAFDAVVIGGGFGGLATAAALRRYGVPEVVLLEGGERYGTFWETNYDRISLHTAWHSLPDDGGDEERYAMFKAPGGSPRLLRPLRRAPPTRRVHALRHDRDRDRARECQSGPALAGPYRTRRLRGALRGRVHGVLPAPLGPDLPEPRRLPRRAPAQQGVSQRRGLSREGRPRRGKRQFGRRNFDGARRNRRRGRCPCSSTARATTSRSRSSPRSSCRRARAVRPVPTASSTSTRSHPGPRPSGRSSASSTQCCARWRKT